MDHLVFIVQLFFLFVMVVFAVYHWLYAKEVHKVTRHTGIIFPSAVEKILKINIFLPIVVAFLITLLILSR